MAKDNLVLNFVCPACRKLIPFILGDIKGKELKCVRCGAVIREKKTESEDER